MGNKTKTIQVSEVDNFQTKIEELVGASAVSHALVEQTITDLKANSADEKHAKRVSHLACVGKWECKHSRLPCAFAQKGILLVSVRMPFLLCIKRELY